jgi:Cdc6-like AAA superfamily ATPase
MPNKAQHFPPEQRTLELGDQSFTRKPSGKRLTIGDMYFGSIDATDELDVASPEGEDIFFNTFYKPVGLDLDAFLNGEKFFVYGLKGTGKTTLLRYLKLKIEREKLSLVTPDFFRFRDEFPKEIYEDAIQSYGKAETDENTQLDYEDIWLYIILKRISELTKSETNNPFKRDKHLSRFHKHLDSIDSRANRNTIRHFLPKISNGKVVISKDPSLELDLEFDNNDKNEISFYKFTSSILNLFKHLTPNPGHNLYILFDEIEIRTYSETTFALDSILVRDLISAIRRINTTNKYNARCVHLIAAIRSEILERVHELGKDTHKRLEQYGYSFNWGSRNANNSTHPLIQMLCKKIYFSEQRAGLCDTGVENYTKYIWNKYFHKNTKDTLPPRYIMDFTWHRPRDFIRLLDSCRHVDSKADIITESLIHRGLKQYSNNSWSEISSQIAIYLGSDHIDAITKSLTGFKRFFTTEELDLRIRELSSGLESAKALNNTIGTLGLVNSLYKCGAFGNVIGNKHRYVFRGDYEAALDKKFCIHKGLLLHFSIALEARKARGQRRQRRHKGKKLDRQRRGA